VDGEAGLGGEGVVRDEPQPRHDERRPHVAAVGPQRDAVAPLLHGEDALARPQLDAALAVVGGEMPRQLGREEARADRLLGEDERHPVARRGERGGELRADEATPHYRDGRAERQRLHALVVGERAEVDDALAVRREAARAPPRGEEQALVADPLAARQHDLPRRPVERRRARAGADGDALHRREPDGPLLRLPGPQRLGERRPRVRRVRLVRQHQDRAARVHRADPPRRRVRRHPPTDHHVLEVAHGTLRVGR
jgi:hypothetical protein